MIFGFVPRRLMGSPRDWDPGRPFDEWMVELEMLIKTAENAGFQYMAVSDTQSLTHFARYAAIPTGIRFVNETLTIPMMDPVHVAPMAAFVDQMLAGRLDFGVSIGYKPWDLDAAGITRKERVPKFMEFLEVTKLMWTQDEVSYHGKYFNFDGLPSTFKPFQKPYPPIITSSQSHGSAARAGRITDGLCIAPAVDHNDVTALANTFREAYYETHGIQPEYVGARRDFFIGPTPKEATRQAGQKEQYLKFEPTHNYLQGRMQEATGVKLHLNPVIDEVPGNAFAGNYQEMAEQFARVAEESGITHVTCSFFNCHDSLSARLEFVEGFGEEVIAKFR